MFSGPGISVAAPRSKVQRAAFAQVWSKAVRLCDNDPGKAATLIADLAVLPLGTPIASMDQEALERVEDTLDERLEP